MDQIPVYIMEGGILPLGPVLEYPGQEEHPSLELIVYPGRDGCFSLYDDEGDSYRYEQGEYCETPVYWRESTRTLTIGPGTGSYPQMPLAQTFRVKAAGKEERTVVLEKGQKAELVF